MTATLPLPGTVGLHCFLSGKEHFDESSVTALSECLYIHSMGMSPPCLPGHKRFLLGMTIPEAMASKSLWNADIQP